MFYFIMEFLNMQEKIWREHPHEKIGLSQKEMEKADGMIQHPRKKRQDPI